MFFNISTHRSEFEVMLAQFQRLKLIRKKPLSDHHTATVAVTTVTVRARENC